MSYPGAMQPPEGVTPDFEHPEDVMRTIVYLTQGLTIFFTTLLIAMRIYAKSKVLVGGSFSTDDCSLLARVQRFHARAGLLSHPEIPEVYLMHENNFIAAAHGAGLNQWEVGKEHMEPFYKACYVATIFYMPMALSVKIALLSIIIRVFGTVHHKTLVGVYLLVGMLCIFYTVGLFIKIFVCWPISSYWSRETGKCLDRNNIIIADTIVTIISDLAILLLPMPLTWSLQLPRRKRLRVGGMLCTGGIATAFSIYRMDLILRERSSHNQTITFARLILTG
ncbi:hypothetical protein E4U41_002549, partial [Claviceps citrina]